jgi:hypothetical protein
MSGIDPYAYMQQVASSMPQLSGKREIETVLDEMEYLYEVMSPEIQGLADQLIRQLRDKLRTAASG